LARDDHDRAANAKSLRRVNEMDDGMCVSRWRFGHNP